LPCCATYMLGAIAIKSAVPRPAQSALSSNSWLHDVLRVRLAIKTKA